MFWLENISDLMHKNECVISTEVKKSLKALTDKISTGNTLPKIESVLQFFRSNALDCNNTLIEQVLGNLPMH
jgi:hypothetical protein